MDAVFEFLRENGFVEAESALREEVIEREGLDDGVGSSNSTVRIVLGRLERGESLSSDDSDEFVSMASGVSGSSSAMGLMNPYGLWSVARVKSTEDSSDALSDFGTAHDYNTDCEVLGGMKWYEEEDGGYLKQPCFGGTDFISYPSEDKFVMTVGAEERFERPSGLNFSTGGFHSETSINFLDKPFHHNKGNDTSMVNVNDCPDSAMLNELGCKERYNCSFPLCDCCDGPKGFAKGDFKNLDYCHETIEQVKGLDVSVFDFRLKPVDESPTAVSWEHNPESCSDHVVRSVRDNQNLASEFPQVEFPMLNSSATSRRPLKNYDSSNHKSSRSSNDSVSRSFENNMDDEEVLKESDLHFQSAEKASGPDGDGAHETENGRDMVEESYNREASNELPMYDFHEDEYEIFNLRIIHRKNRTGFEENKDLPIVLNTILAGRYYVTEYLGSAAFSRVIQAHDLHTGIDVCLKIINNDKDFFDQSLDEIKLLKFVNKHDPADERHILRLYDYFYHQEHLFIVCELLRANLYEFQKFNQDSDGELYFTLPRLQTITRQCLEALEYLHQLGIIHCDLKPENILIKSYSRCEIKVIDLGSSCFQTDNLSLYVQSRSYRAPEVILGLPYDPKIDIWSLGCILAELCSGDVLFPNDSVVMMLARMIGMLGPIDMEMLEKGQETHKYFTDDYDLYQRNEETNQLEYVIAEKFSLAHRLQVSDLKFVAFVRGLLRTNPRKRPTAREALQHPWLSYRYE